MRIRSWLLVAALPVAALLLGACGGSSRALLNAASRDFGCPRRYLTVVGLERNVRGVYGCNTRATYVRSCGRGRCVWTQDMRYMNYWR